MADSILSICNRALALLGSKSFITSLTEGSAQADQCNIQVEPARKQTLTDFDWPFARTYSVLTEYGTAPDRWSYQYIYPAKCLYAREINYGTRTDDPVPFQVGNIIDAGSERRVIWTDIEDATLIYTYDYETVSFMPPAFQEAFAANVAYKICLPLTRDKQLMGQLANYYGAMLNRAEVLQGNEGVEDVNERQATWIEARNGPDHYSAAKVLDPD
jgi:hypothetical protein